MSDRPPGDGRARRAGVVVAIVALFVLALGVFVLPFAFPTPPPLVTRFNATLLFSPDGDGRREEAKVNVRLSQAADVTVEVQREGETVRRLITSRRAPRGWVREDWDGRDDAGRRVPDGTYAIKLRARAGRKQFNTTRTIVVDTAAPRPAEMAVESATLGRPGPGECRVTFASRDPGSVVIEALRDGDEEPLRRLGPRPVRPDAPVRWRWDGRRADGGTVPPGSTRSAPRSSTPPATGSCASGPAGSATSPARPVPAAVAPRERVGASLRRTGGDPPRPVGRRHAGAVPPHRHAGRDPGRPAGRPGRRRRPRPGRARAGADPAGHQPLRALAGGPHRRRPRRGAGPAGGLAVNEAARKVAAFAAAFAVLGLLLPLPRLRSEAQRAGALAVLLAAWAVLLGTLVPEDDARDGLDRLASPWRRPPRPWA